LLHNDEGLVEFQCFDLDGAVFGRLPIFGSQPEDHCNDEGDDNDDNMDTQMKEYLQTYQKQFGLLDWYFLTDPVQEQHCGNFVLRTLSLMASRLNGVQTFMKDCLKQGIVLAKMSL
jgi:hypothetical protein